MSNITIKQIAQMAGVSTTAVSFVINGRGGVSTETEERVKKIIAQTGFVPSLRSKSLLMKKSFNISILINANSSPFDDLFYFEIMRGILENSRKFGYNIMIADLRSGRNRLPDVVYSNDTDGIIFLQDIDDETLAQVRTSKIPFLIIDRHDDDDGIVSINPDYALASYTATKYLLENGHRDIAFITSQYIENFKRQTLSGFERAMKEKGLAASSALVKTQARDEISAYKCMCEILSCAAPTAVMCAVDIFAIGAMKAVKDSGLCVPKDISFVGIDDILLSSYCEPRLTTIHIDKLKMGRLAMESISAMIDGEAKTSIMIKSDELVVRGSVRRL